MIDSDQLKQNLDRLAASLRKSEARQRQAEPKQPPTIAKEIYPHLPSVHDKEAKRG